MRFTHTTNFTIESSTLNKKEVCQGCGCNCPCDCADCEKCSPCKDH